MGQWSNRQWGCRVCRFHIPGGTFQGLKYPSESKDENWKRHGTFIILAAERLGDPQHCEPAPECTGVVPGLLTTYQGCQSKTGAGPHLLRVTADARLLADVGVGLVQEVCGIGACLGQDAPRQAIRLLQQSFHQVLSLHNLVAALQATTRQDNSGSAQQTKHETVT